jgi:hypothetical protein
MPLLDLDSLTDTDKDIFRRGLYDHNVLVIRSQAGLRPTVLPQLGKFFDETAGDLHSAGETAVKDPRNILAVNRATRIPCAPQVTVIGQGEFEGYEGIKKLSLKHVVSPSVYLNLHKSHGT